MGKRIISQNRGKGTPTYRAPSHRYKAALKLIKADKDEDVKARVVEVLHDPARSAPIARVELADGTAFAWATKSRAERQQRSKLAIFCRLPKSRKGCRSAVLNRNLATEVVSRGHPASTGC